MRDWDTFFIEMARHASTMSTCSRRSVGCVIVQAKHVVATGFNGNAPKALHCDEGGCPRCADLERGTAIDLHVCLCVHAEQNAVAWCARYGVRTEGATAYTTTKPCLDCLKLLASAGVTKVIYDLDYPVELPDFPTITVVQRSAEVVRTHQRAW